MDDYYPVSRGAIHCPQFVEFASFILMYTNWQMYFYRSLGAKLAVSEIKMQGEKQRITF